MGLGIELEFTVDTREDLARKRGLGVGFCIGACALDRGAAAFDDRGHVVRAIVGGVFGVNGRQLRADREGPVRAFVEVVRGATCGNKAAGTEDQR